MIWVIPISVYLFNWNLIFIIKRFVFCTAPSQLWFLWMLFGVFVIVWPIRNIFVSRPGLGLLIALLLYILGFAGIKNVPNIFCFWTACQYVLFFYIGIRIRIGDENGVKLATNNRSYVIWLLLDILLFIAYMLIKEYNEIRWTIIAAILELTVHVVGSIMAWVSLQEFASRLGLRNNRTIKSLSKYSMPMYMFHQQIIYFMIIWLDGKINPWIHATANFLTAFVISLVISVILMKWRTTRFLIGET